MNVLRTTSNVVTPNNAVAARGYLPLGANVCVAAPAYQTSFAIGAFFRISDIGCVTTLGGPRLFA